MKKGLLALLLGVLFAVSAGAQSKDHYGYLFGGAGRSQGHPTFQVGYGMSLYVGARLAFQSDVGYLRVKQTGFFTTDAGASFRLPAVRRVVPYVGGGYGYFVWTGSPLDYGAQGFGAGYYAAGALYSPHRGPGFMADFRRYDRPGGPAFNQVRVGVLFRFGGEHR